MLKSGFTGPIFSSLRKLHTASHTGCTNLHSHQQCRKVPFFPHPHQHLMFSLSLIMAIVTGVRWYISVVLVWISSITREIELSSCIYWPFVPLPLRIPCLTHMSISSLGCWIFRGWVSWVPCRFWILVPYWKSRWQRLSIILWAVSLV
jgi:hypothetical protein